MLKFSIFFIILVFFLNQNINAHARWTLNGTLTPRSTNAGIKTGPCGGFQRIATPKVFQAGSSINVEWEETINHPGRFEIYFSPADDANFVLLKTIIDTKNGGLSSTSITLPNTACTACTLQLIQVMTENPDSPSLYYSCADIQLTEPSSNTTPTTTPNPSSQAEKCN